MQKRSQTSRRLQRTHRRTRNRSFDFLFTRSNRTNQRFDLQKFHFAIGIDDFHRLAIFWILHGRVHQRHNEVSMRPIGRRKRHGFFSFRIYQKIENAFLFFSFQLPHEQGAVISCLMSKKDDLTSACSKGIDRITEMQSNDFHLDRKLFLACREDQQKFCTKVAPGNGQIYRCLYREKFNSLMSSSVSRSNRIEVNKLHFFFQCRAEIQRRQKTVVSNIKLDAPFMKGN